jgi:hypothetical protein
MSKLVDLLSFLKSEGALEGNSMAAYIAEMHLDNKGNFDIHFLRDLLEENVTKTQLQKAYKDVFGIPLPLKFTFIKAETCVTKEDFLNNIYEPAKYRNVRSWVGHMMLEYGRMINRKDVFDWIMSTAKPKTFSGDTDD